MDIMSMALRIQALEAENARLHETIRDMRKPEAPTFPNTMSVLKTVGFVNFLDPQTINNLSQAHRAFKGELPVAKIMERSRLALDNARVANQEIEHERNEAYKFLARMWRSPSLPEYGISEIVRFFAEAGITNQSVERFAEDSLGPMPHHMLEDSEEGDDSEGEDDEQF